MSETTPSAVLPEPFERRKTPAALPLLSDEIQNLREQLELNRLELDQESRDLINLHRELEESHDRYVSLYEFAPVLYLTLNRSGVILNINLKGALALGNDHAHVLQKAFRDYVVPEDWPVLDRHLQACAASADEVISELRLNTRDRPAVPVQLTSISVREMSRGIQIYPTAIIDLTERKKIEQELLRREGELHETRKMEAMGRLAGGVAHDFNNMITGIQGLTSEIKETLPAEDKRIADLDEVVRTCQRAFNLTRQLLAFGRRQAIRPTTLNLNTTVHNMERLLRPLIGEDIELSLQLEPGLGSIRADEGHMEQVLTNLVLNARDAMPQGGRITILTANTELPAEIPRRSPKAVQGSYVCLRVSDTGTGMDEKTLSRIFEPFYTTKEERKGTGLGLPTVHGIVKQNGGEIDVHSQAGQGSTFEVYLPRVNEQAHTERRGASRELRSGHETVLLVEDESIVWRFALRLLTQQGYKVLPAENGADALRLAASYPGRIDLLLTDVIMPGMNGRKLAEQLNRERPETIVLFMSGYPADVISERGIMDPDVSFIEKSQLSRNLAHRVRALLDASRTKA